MARFRSPAPSGDDLDSKLSLLSFTFLSLLGSARWPPWCLKGDTGYLFGRWSQGSFSPIYPIGGILTGATPLGLG